jgi:hypothetical protein
MEIVLNDPATARAFVHSQAAADRVKSANGEMRLALRVEEAAAALGMSRDSFDRHVLAELRTIRRGRMVLVPVLELERWCEQEAGLP